MRSGGIPVYPQRPNGAPSVCYGGQNPLLVGTPPRVPTTSRSWLPGITTSRSRYLGEMKSPLEPIPTKPGGYAETKMALKRGSWSELPESSGAGLGAFVLIRRVDINPRTAPSRLALDHGSTDEPLRLGVSLRLGLR